MNRILKYKHWQIFLCVFGPPLVFFCFLVNADNWNPILIFSPLVALILFGCLLTYNYFLAVISHKKQVFDESMELRNFKIVFLVYVAYFVISLLGMIGIPIIDFEEWKVPLDFISQGANIYLLWYISKTLRTIELQRPAEFSEYVTIIILLWFFPVGIWFVQPRVNKIFESEPEGREVQNT